MAVTAMPIIQMAVVMAIIRHKNHDVPVSFDVPRSRERSAAATILDQNSSGGGAPLPADGRRDAMRSPFLSSSAPTFSSFAYPWLGRSASNDSCVSAPPSTRTRYSTTPSGCCSLKFVAMPSHPSSKRRMCFGFGAPLVTARSEWSSETVIALATAPRATPNRMSRASRLLKTTLLLLPPKNNISAVPTTHHTMTAANAQPCSSRRTAWHT